MHPADQVPFAEEPRQIWLPAIPALTKALFLEPAYSKFPPCRENVLLLGKCGPGIAHIVLFPDPAYYQRHSRQPHLHIPELCQLLQKKLLRLGCMLFLHCGHALLQAFHQIELFLPGIGFANRPMICEVHQLIGG